MKKTFYGLIFLVAVLFILFYSGKIVEGHGGGGGGGHGGGGHGGGGHGGGGHGGGGHGGGRGGRGYGRYGGWGGYGGYGGGTYEVNPLLLDSSPDFLYEYPTNYPWYWYPRRYYARYFM